MNYRKLEISKSSIFYIAWIIMVIHFCVANSNMQDYSRTLVSYIAMSLFGIKIILQRRYSIKEICIMAFLCVWGILTYKVTDDMRVFWFAIVLCASKDIDFDKSVRYSFRTMLLCCILFFISYKIGIIDETMVDSVRGIRHSFGLGHPNMCAAYYALLMIQYIYINFKKINILHINILIVGTFLIYSFTKSTTGLITAVVSLLIVIVLKYVSFKKINSQLIIYFLICGILAFTIIPIIYNKGFSSIDALLTGRLHQAHFYFKKYGIGLLGKNINADLNNIYTDNILDIGYARMLINNGLIYYLTIVVGYIIAMFEAWKSERRDIIALMSCFVVYMFTENVATYIFMNVTMLLFSYYLYRKTSID